MDRPMKKFRITVKDKENGVSTHEQAGETEDLAIDALAIRVPWDEILGTEEIDESLDKRVWIVYMESAHFGREEFSRDGIEAALQTIRTLVKSSIGNGGLTRQIGIIVPSEAEHAPAEEL